MSSVNCIWNYDLDNFEDCCVWAYRKCDPIDCVSKEPRQEGRIATIPAKPARCIECEEIPVEEELLP